MTKEAGRKRLDDLMWVFLIIGIGGAAVCLYMFYGFAKAHNWL